MDAKQPKSFSDVIRLWGTAPEMATDVGVTQLVIRAWKRRGSIPGEYWTTVAAAAQKKPFAALVTLEVLATLGSQRKQVAA